MGEVRERGGGKGGGVEREGEARLGRGGKGGGDGEGGRVRRGRERRGRREWEAGEAGRERQARDLVFKNPTSAEIRDVLLESKLDDCSFVFEWPMSGVKG